MGKSIYFVQSYVPHDEAVISSNIFKLVTIGMNEKKHGWVSVLNEGGIGTGTDNWGEDSRVSAIIQVVRHIDPDARFEVIETSDFGEVIETLEGFEELLQDELSKRAIELRTAAK
ncbi:hypothetical protein [Roseivirga spongicola]|nr:hypothetical protein [Roseivirga spongicola]